MNTYQQFVAVHPTNSERVIVIQQGVEGFHDAPHLEADQVDQVNEALGVTPLQRETAITCSMFDVWANFDSILARNSGQAILEL